MYGDVGKGVLEELTKPVSKYYVRCNSLKISPKDLQEKLRSHGFKIELNPAIQEAIPEALALHLEGPFEVPMRGQEIIVDKKTAESAMQGANVYAPGIMNCGSMHVGDEITIVSELGDVIASGRAVMSTNDILTFRKGLAVQIEHRRFEGPSVRELPEFSQGLLYPQSLAAMVTSRVLGPKPNETIVDMNCAPGGKLSHMSQLTENSGRLLGFDRNSQKLTQTRNSMSRLGCTNAVLSIHDSRYLDADFPDLKADRVLIDPPCSALGLRPKVYDFTSINRVNNMANYQKQFVKTASRLAKPGGVIVYSVCTITKEECEQIAEFAERECDLKIMDQRPFIGSKSLFFQSGLFCQRFNPHVDEIGYFIAKFKR